MGRRGVESELSVRKKRNGPPGSLGLAVNVRIGLFSQSHSMVASSGWLHGTRWIFLAAAARHEGRELPRPSGAAYFPPLLGQCMYTFDMMTEEEKTSGRDQIRKYNSDNKQYS